jgi:hypothetical protein
MQMDKRRRNPSEQEEGGCSHCGLAIIYIKKSTLRQKKKIYENSNYFHHAKI